MKISETKEITKQDWIEENQQKSTIEAVKKPQLI